MNAKRQPRSGGILTITAVFAVMFILCLSVVSYFVIKPATAQKLTTPREHLEPVKRGEYLVTLMSCHDCHTPWTEGPNGAPEPDMTRMLSGHPAGAPYPTWTPDHLQKGNALVLANMTFTAWAGPWGVSFTANLTPDKETGLGEWTEEAFIQAVRTGKHQGQPNGRDILPPMPWPYISKATDDDLKAIWAYLRSIPAIKNEVPLPVPPGASSAM